MIGLRRAQVFMATAAMTVILAVMAACAPQPEDCRRPGTRCAGLVTGFGPVSAGISHEAWLGLEDALAAGLVDRVDFIETVDVRDREPNIREFAEAGYDIVVTVGAASTDETLAVAKVFPEQLFIGIQPSLGEATPPDNFVGLMFHEERSGFLGGVVASLISETGRVAALCEAEYIDSIRRTCEGFRRGAAYARSEIEVDITYRTGPSDLLFHDAEWGQTAAAASIDRGADVVFAVGEGTAEAALTAAAKQGVLVIGAEVDQYSEIPEIRGLIVTSALLHVRAGLAQTIQATIEGRPPARIFWGEIGLAPFRDFEDRLAPSVREAVQRIWGDLNAGVIDLGNAP